MQSLSQDFRDQMSLLAAGVVVLTRVEEERLIGLTLSSFNSLSLSPLLIFFNIDKAARHSSLLTSPGNFCINLLSSNQVEVAEVFSRRYSDFNCLVEWRYSAENFPCIERANAHFFCTRKSIHDEGDHYIVVGEVVGSSAPKEIEPPLVYHGRRYCTVQGLRSTL